MAHHVAPRRMLHDIVSAVYRGGYLIPLEFDDGPERNR